MRYIDISGRLENGMWGYHVLPGLERIIPEVRVKTIATIDNVGFFASKFEFSSISGTYVETGAHMIKGYKVLEDYGIEDFIKPVKIIRIPYLKGKESVTVDHLKKSGTEVKKGEALIVDTGWWRRWNKDGYVLNSPYYSKDALMWILDKEISIFGVDVPCIESAWSEDNKEEKGSLLKEMFKRGILLVAPLVNLGKIKSNSGTVYCFPINVKGSCGAPARVVFEEII